MTRLEFQFSIDIESVKLKVQVCKYLTGAMKLDWWKRQLFGDVTVLNFGGLVHLFALDPLRGQRGGGDGRAAAKGLELGIDDLAIIIDFNLKSKQKGLIVI